MFRLIPVLLVFFLRMSNLFGEVPHWPLPGERPHDSRALRELLQPTVSGLSESALFGCVRNDGNRFHEGLDLAPVLPRVRGEAVDPVFAIHEGRVAHLSAEAGMSSYGRYVVIEHEGMRPAFYSLYAHLATVSEELRVGDWVSSGTQVGVLGRSAAGYVIPRERAHLHLEIGLRLSGHFQSWYDRQDFGSENDHGNFNGMNLCGMDPAAYLLGSVGQDSAAFFENLPVAVLLRVGASSRPELLERCPAMELPTELAGPVAGWEITLTAWGLPLSLKPLSAGDMGPAMREGEAQVLAIDADQLQAFACRDIVVQDGVVARLGSGGRRIIELLFSGLGSIE